MRVGRRGASASESEQGRALRREALPRRAKFACSGDFARMRAAPRFRSGPHFEVFLRPNAVGFPRLGIMIAKKTVGRAVDRNKIKRLIRETFRTNQFALHGCDLLVRVRANCSTSWGEARAELLGFWTNGGVQCRGS